MEMTIDKNELYSLIKKAVKEVFEEEKFELLLKNIPLISDQEMEDIEKHYGKPSVDKEVAHSEIVEI